MERNVVPVNAASHVRAPLKILGRDFFRDYDRIVDSVFHASSTKEVAGYWFAEAQGGYGGLREANRSHC